MAALCAMLMAAEITPGTGPSLSDCCAHFDITIDGAYRAATDALATTTATATAKLLGEYIRATSAEPSSADAVSSARSAWVQIEGERAPWKPRPGADYLPLHFVKRIAVRLPEHARPKAEQSYLAILDRVLMDFKISAHAADDLLKPAESLELGRAGGERLHFAFFQAPAEIAWADNVLTDEGRAHLHAVARLLRIPDVQLKS